MAGPEARAHRRERARGIPLRILLVALPIAGVSGTAADSTGEGRGRSPAAARWS